MNGENLMRLADYIEGQPNELFNMSLYGGTECKTNGDTLSHAHVLFGGKPEHQLEWRALHPGIWDALDLESGDPRTGLLFFPTNNFADIDAKEGRLHISKGRAVRQLRYVAEHDKIDWSMTP